LRCASGRDKPILLGRHLVSERDIFLLEEALSAEPRITLPSTFACFCALDASELSVDQIGEFCEALHFFLFDTTPYEEARAVCRSGLITAANPAWVTEIKQYISTHLAQRA
jgi:hypothetical protein